MTAKQKKLADKVHKLVTADQDMVCMAADNCVACILAGSMTLHTKKSYKPTVSRHMQVHPAVTSQAEVAETQDLRSSLPACSCMHTVALMCTSLLQTEKLKRTQRELLQLDDKAKQNALKLKNAQADVARAQADIDNLPPPLSGFDLRKKSLGAQKRDLDVQVCAYAGQPSAK